MLKRLKNLYLGQELYVKVFKNQFEIDNISNGMSTAITSMPEEFTTTRLLVGNFQTAVECLSNGINCVIPSPILIKPSILIHPLEMTEGGLSEVERTVFRDLAMSVGARKVVIWEGERLEVSQIQNKIRNAKANSSVQ